MNADAPHDPTGKDHTRLEWVDVEKRTWRVGLPPHRVLLESEETVIELPESTWARDIYVAEHGQRYVIRIERFDQAVRFLVPAADAAPFLEHVSVPRAGTTAPDAQTDGDDAPRRPAPLLWPKVSPWAIWALICSALVFIPFLGLLFAAATVALLALHRRAVRRAPAWRHSRALCTAAFVFLLAGLCVSALTIWGLWHHADTLHQHRVSAHAAAEGRNWGIIASGLFVVLLSLSVHEAAHAITAWWLGDGLARSLGRVTLNPMAHVDPFGTLLLPLILVLAGGPVFGYARPVPVQVESLPRHRRAHILISLAGPGSNMLLAAASLMMLLALGCVVGLAGGDAVVTNFATGDFAAPVTAKGFFLASVFGPFCTILKLSFLINTVLAMFNLIPIPPLDGSWVLEHMFPGSLGRVYAAIRPYGFLIFIGAIYLDLFYYMLMPVTVVLAPGFALLAEASGL